MLPFLALLIGLLCFFAAAFVLGNIITTLIEWAEPLPSEWGRNKPTLRQVVIKRIEFFKELRGRIW